DLKNKTLLPGLIDSHLHISMYGANQLFTIPCKDYEINTIEDLLYEITEKVKETPLGNWVRVSGFNETNIEEQRFPTKEELDNITRNHTIIVMRTCGHISVVNSKALEIGSIDKDTPDPSGGEIGRDSKGNPNGMLYENAHMNMFSIASYTEEELSEA